ncbi:uncharacterized protein LOC135121282 isoform X2 [Zophobas morio]|uniref:uncharacterized protein LOC135121282 isoform X2 n=1 Tax=Zophobas morio TaxID=2755281 RepID=UPI003083C4A8
MNSDVPMKEAQQSDYKRDWLHSLPSPNYDVKKLHSEDLSEQVSLKNDSSDLFIVWDTNVLLSHLSLIVKLKASLFVPKKNSKTLLIIPWIVLTELDKLKSSRKEDVAVQARMATRTLLQWFQVKDPLVRGQTIYETEQLVDCTVESADDRILQCCLYFLKKKSFQSSNKANSVVAVPETVILVTNDRNLSVKALVHGIQVCDVETLPTLLKTLRGINLEPSCIEVGAPISKLEVSPPFERSDPSFLLSECWSCFSSYTLETALLKQIDSQKILKSGSFWTSTTFRTAEKLFSGKGSLDADSLSFLKDIKVIETRTFLLAKNALDALAKSPLSHCETVQCMENILKAVKSFPQHDKKKRVAISSINQLKTLLYNALRSRVRPTPKKNSLLSSPNGVSSEPHTIRVPLEQVLQVLRWCSFCVSVASGSCEELEATADVTSELQKAAESASTLFPDNLRLQYLLRSVAFNERMLLSTESFTLSFLFSLISKCQTIIELLPVDTMTRNCAWSSMEHLKDSFAEKIKKIDVDEVESDTNGDYKSSNKELEMMEIVHEDIKLCANASFEVAERDFLCLKSSLILIDFTPESLLRHLKLVADSSFLLFWRPAFQHLLELLSIIVETLRPLHQLPPVFEYSDSSRLVTAFSQLMTTFSVVSSEPSSLQDNSLENITRLMLFCFRQDVNTAKNLSAFCSEKILRIKSLYDF